MKAPIQVSIVRKGGIRSVRTIKPIEGQKLLVYVQMHRFGAGL
jgi:hypothetical protein